MLDTNKGILAKMHLIFHKKKIYANVFYLVNADLVRHKVFALCSLYCTSYSKACSILNFCKLFLKFPFSDLSYKISP